MAPFAVDEDEGSQVNKTRRLLDPFAISYGIYHHDLCPFDV